MNNTATYTALTVPRLNTQVVGSRILVFDEVDSTNERALHVGGDGTVIVADRQKAGRGRHGRPWHSAPGLGLWFSISFAGNLEGAAFLAPLAVRAALRPIADVSLKWPNDVLIDGRKLCGILVERRLGHTVVGIGINVNHEATDFPPELRGSATSIRRATGASPDRSVLLRDVLSELDRLVALARSGELDRLREAWAETCGIRGKRVRYQDFEGVVTNVDQHGGLTVAAPDGEHRIVFGEIVQLEEA
jgi:BirA family transcriptional regulator, biotin operon repressor / biotin---[acetyl-CoA-carboxylase] ligase